MLEIGLAAEADIPSMAALLGDLFALERDFEADEAKQMRGLAMLLADPGVGQLFSAREDGRVVGMASMLASVSTAEGGRVFVLEDLVVEARLRGAGIGSQLLAHALDWGRAQGALRVTVLTDARNHRAMNFYARHGFAPSGMRVMRVSLQPV